MIHDNVRDLRALLRESAIVLDTHDPALAKRLWAAHDALTVEAINHPAIPDGSRDDRRDHDRHPPRVI